MIEMSDFILQKIEKRGPMNASSGDFFFNFGYSLNGIRYRVSRPAANRQGGIDYQADSQDLESLAQCLECAAAALRGFPANLPAGFTHEYLTPELAALRQMTLPELMAVNKDAHWSENEIAKASEMQAAFQASKC